jgi:DNA helicase II / ATP-dependent DNA helicase PcrA
MKLLDLDPTDGLNPEQVAAVQHVGGPLCVVAGAGSGKTKVIERRVLELMRRGTPPGRILLLTFTRRAANEMRERLAAATPYANEIPALTYHAFAFRTLMKNHRQLGFHTQPTVIDDDDSLRLVRKRMADAGLPSPKETKRNDGTLSAKDTLALLSSHVNTRRPFEELHDRFAGELTKLYDFYVKDKREGNFVDYDDLLILLLRLLRENAAVVVGDFDHVLVDEFQDTNVVQGEITWLLVPHGNLMLVGDPRQAIYGFRGAVDGNILEAMSRGDVSVVRLVRNYRSHEGVLGLANRVLGDHGALVSVDGRVGPDPVFVGFDTVFDEADFVAGSIGRLLAGGVKASEVAVLTRTNALHAPLQARLVRGRIPFRTFGGGSLLRMAHVKDVLAFVRLVLNPKDRLAGLRVLMLYPGVGEKTAEGIVASLDYGAPDVLEHWASVRSKSFGPFLHSLSVLIRSCWAEVRPGAVVRLIVKHYEGLLGSRFDDVKARKQDLEALVELVDAYGDLNEFLGDVMLDVGVSEDDSGEFVSVSSIHAAKGLEWRVVFLLGADDDSMPHWWSMRVGGSGSVAEERRLAYVAVTRAKERLVVSFSRFRNSVDLLQALRANPGVPVSDLGRSLSRFFRDRLGGGGGRKVVRGSSVGVGL